MTLSPVLVENIWVGKPDASSRIFKDKRVFQLDYVPGRVLHREEQDNRIKLTLRDLERGVRAKHILCLGVFGTGKTVVVRSVCRNLPSAPMVAYINCAEENTRVKILQVLSCRDSRAVLNVQAT